MGDYDPPGPVARDPLQEGFKPLDWAIISNFFTRLFTWHKEPEDRPWYCPENKTQVGVK